MAKTEHIEILAVRNNRKSIRMIWRQGVDDYDVTFHENPKPSLYKSLDALSSHVCSLCEFRSEDAKKIQATGITVRTKGEIEQALIVARKRIKKGKRVFNISTPLLPMRANPENDKADHMDEETADAIDKVIAEAKKYIGGDRAQGQIEFVPEPGEADEAPEENDKTTKFPGMEEPAKG